jgi:hypothetical protein
VTLSDYILKLKGKGLSKPEVLVKAKSKVKLAGKRWTTSVQEVFDTSWKKRVPIAKEKPEKKPKVAIKESPVKKGKSPIKDIRSDKKPRTTKIKDERTDSTGAPKKPATPREVRVNKYISKYSGNLDPKNLRSLLLDSKLKKPLLSNYPGTDGTVYSDPNKAPKSGAFIWRRETDDAGEPIIGFPNLVTNTKPSKALDIKAVRAAILKKGTFYLVEDERKKARILRVCRTKWIQPTDATRLAEGSFLDGQNVLHWQEYTSKFTVAQWNNIYNARKDFDADFKAIREQRDREHVNR